MIAGLVTTIIPVHNRASGLREAVASVIAQDYRPIEVLVVDDGSTDDTPQAAEGLAREHPGIVRILRQQNAGPGAAREHGRSGARGEFLQYLDSDDVLLPGKFSAQVGALRADPQADIAYGWVRFRDETGNVHPEPWKRTGESLVALFPAILVERWWDTGAPLYRAAICNRAGAWLPLRNEEDWEYDCRIGALGARLAHVAAFVCETRDLGGDRLSRHGAARRALQDRATAHEAMFAHAETSGLARERPEFQAFARRLFLLARQCGAAGLRDEAQRLFALARRASTDTRRNGLDFRLYALLSGIMGWRVAGRLAVWSDRVRAR